MERSASTFSDLFSAVVSFVVAVIDFVVADAFLLKWKSFVHFAFSGLNRLVDWV